MVLVTASEKSKCVLCGRVTREFLQFKRSGIEIRISLCEEHQKTATFNLFGGLKHTTDTIRHMVVLSSICGYDEREISKMQREKALAERQVK